jgi:hypothetical protein
VANQRRDLRIKKQDSLAGQTQCIVLTNREAHIAERNRISSVPLGYDAKEKRLVINKAEAETVRTVFGRYLKR